MNVPLITTATVALGSSPVELVDVLRSVEAYHPLVLAAATEVDVARGELLGREGAFDTKVKAKGGGYASGFYDGLTGALEVRQPITLWGAELYAGYRYGADHPIYDALKTTSRFGEVGAGVMVPILQGGPIDERRAEIQQAEAGVEIAELLARQKLLETKVKAATSYWKWVGDHEKLRIAEAQLALAEVRSAGIEERVNRGQLPRLELVDNERLIVARLEDVVAARREVQRRALTLSLFLRGDDGRPRIPEAGRVRPGLPEPGPAPRLDASVIRDAFAGRPEPTRYDRVLSQLRTELALAENGRLPRVDLHLSGSKDLGEPELYGPDPKLETKNAAELRLGVSVSWPVQQRKARGKRQSVEAKVRALTAKRVFVLDAIETEVRDAWSELDAARARVGLARRTLALTRQIEVSERRRFDLGGSSILQVNLREEASGKAAKSVVEALVDYHSARAIFGGVTATL